MNLRAPDSRALGAIVLASLSAPLLALAISGLFSRYAADDYCTAGQVQMAGFVEAQSRLYVGWSGRFAATFLVTLVELIGPGAVSILPTLALLAWLAAASWSIRKLVAAPGWRLTPLNSWVLAALVVFATLDTTADLPQVLFWQTGVLTYLCPLVLATLYVGWVARAASGPVAVGVSFALTFLAGGTSETFAAAQVAALALAVIIAALAGALPGRSRRQAMLLAGLVGAVLALAIVAVSPGNEVRQDAASRLPLTIAIPHALQFTQGWLRLTFARPHAILLLLLLGLTFWKGASAQRTSPALGTPRVRKELVLVVGLLATALVIFACMLPAFYALGSNPPGRAQIIPQSVLVCALSVLSWLAGTATAAPSTSGRGRGVRGAYELTSSQLLSWAAAGGLVALLVLGPLLAAARDLQQLNTARGYAMAWDQLDAQVRAEHSRGARDVTVARLPSTGNVQNLEFVGTNRRDWFNDCVARYYDLSSIAADA